MTVGYQAPRCQCGHAVGSHASGGTGWPHPPQRGVCLVPDCDCRTFRDRDTDTTSEDA